MQLPDLHLLEQLFYISQLKKVKKDGYACFTSGAMNGMGAFCFFDDLQEWKDLYPAIVFIDALLDRDYSIYDKEELGNLTLLYNKYINTQWNETDLLPFFKDYTQVGLNYCIEFLGKTSTLFELNSNDEFIKRIQNDFKDDPKENEEAFLEFLDGYTT